jgi:hypothetical protein
MRNLLLLVGVISTTLCMAGTIDTITPSNNHIEYTGRIDFTNPDAPAFSYSGVSIRACFTGTSIGMIMNDDTGQNYYNILLDGRILDTIRISLGKKSYKIAEGLENTTHEIEIVKRTEIIFGKTQFFGFVVDEGSNLTGIATTRTKLIEFIGNSITCGYGNEGINGEAFGPKTENQYLSFAAITSRNFNARSLAVCKSGIGIYRNYNGPAAGNADCMTNYYTRTLFFNENPKYSFTDKPDLVCIDLGTNDFSTSGGDSAKFVSNYFRLIDTIQTKYAMPDIVCLQGPMLGGATLTTIRKYLSFIADSANKKGKGNVYFFEMSAQTGDLGIAIDYHPTVAQHTRNAQELTGFIKSLKGWEINPLIINANVTEANQIKLEFNTPVQDNENEFSGFVLYKNDQAVDISSVYLDPTDKKIVHIIMQQPFIIGDKINLSYVPGTIESTDSILVGTINYLPVLNNLTETKITRAASTTDGTTVLLTFNKKLNENSTIEGLIISDSRGLAAINSYAVSNTQLKLYLKNNLLKDDSVFASYIGTNILGIDNVILNSFTKMVIKNSSSHISGLADKLQSQVVLYPNPNSTGKFYYCFDSSTNFKNANLEIFNTNGELVYSQKITESEGLIKLTQEISNGVYIFKFNLDQFAITKSIIKK